MSNYRYFADINGTTTELKMVFHDGGKAFGTPVDFTPTFDRVAQKWNRGEVLATRVIQYKSNPSKHECDARCLNAVGKVMRCECSCGGKNHGRGSLVCAEAA